MSRSDSDARHYAEISSADRTSLPRSFYVPQEDPRAELRETVNTVLSDKFMAFISLFVIPIILLPLIFRIPREDLLFLDVCDWLLIGIFLIEYLSKLYLAKDRWQHFKSGWHLLDLAIVVIPFFQYLPFLGVTLTGSPSLLLRLLRLPRAFAVGGRAVAGRMREEAAIVPKEKVEAKIKIRMVDSNLTVYENLTWDALIGYIRNERQKWIDISNMTDDGFRRLSEILHIPEQHFKSKLLDELYPHVDYVGQASLIFLHTDQLRYPEFSDSYLKIIRSGVIAICMNNNIITVSLGENALFNTVLSNTSTNPEAQSFVVMVLHNILSHLLSEYRSILSEIEFDILRVSGIPRSKLPKDFLERIYELNKEMSRLASNMSHLRETLGIIIKRHVTLSGFDEDSKKSFEALQDEASYDHEVAANLRGSLLSIIDLYIDRTSYETNRILKILAVITSLSIIPTTIGGLLGENLRDVPFNLVLWQIVGITAILMSLSVYVFTRLGWLKT